MELLDSLIELLKYVLPAGLVFLTMRWMQQQRLAERKLEAQAQWQQTIAKEQSPLIFHAYERALLFLARLEPDQLLVRVGPGNQSAVQYARLLEMNIKEEYEHNLAQQLYILPGTWEKVSHTQIAVRGMIMQALQTLPEGANSQDLHRLIWETWTGQEQPITLPATLMLKKDAQSLLIRGDLAAVLQE